MLVDTHMNALFWMRSRADHFSREFKHEVEAKHEDGLETRETLTRLRFITNTKTSVVYRL